MIDLLMVLVGGGWLTLCFHGLLRHVRKRRAAELRAQLALAPGAPKESTGGAAGFVTDDGLWRVWYSTPTERNTFDVTPLQATAIRQYLDLACRGAQTPAETVERIQHEIDALQREEIRALEP